MVEIVVREGAYVGKGKVGEVGGLEVRPFVEEVVPVELEQRNE